MTQPPMTQHPVTQRPENAALVPDRSFSLRRIGSMGLRYLYLLRSSWTRIVELAYWPIMQMIMWGFMTEFLRKSDSQVLQAAGVLIAAVLLWDVMFRSNIGVAVSFLEEMWSRNLAQLFASPLRPYEWALSLLFISLVRTVIGVLPAALLAIPLYHYSIFEMGLPLVAFFACLTLFGGAIGLMVRDGRREPRLGRHLSRSADQRHLLSDFGAARLAAACRLGPAVGACVRGHARSAG
jgi:ABC-2 type transport system permease protein